MNEIFMCRLPGARQKIVPLKFEGFHEVHNEYASVFIRVFIGEYLTGDEIVKREQGTFYEFFPEAGPILDIRARVRLFLQGVNPKLDAFKGDEFTYLL